MKICTIICEYNPLHNGHVRLLQFARQHADTICCVMSGNFVQRGMPAVMDKYSRARHAILAGADIVIELPTVLALSSAENFATGGVNIARAIGSQFMAFGCESANAQQLFQCATLLEDVKVNNSIKKFINEGNSYPKAVAMSLPQFEDILSRPNNTLALEYTKAILKSNSDIQLLVCDRPDNYDSDKLEGIFSSATAIRNNLDNENIRQSLPYFTKVEDINVEVEKQYKRFAALYLSLQPMTEQTEAVSEGLHNRFNKFRNIGNYNKLIESVKTKRYTQTRLQRIIAAHLLGITKDITAVAKATAPYITVLAINSKREDLLTYIAQRQLDYTQQVADERRKLIDIDLKAQLLYSALTNKLPISQLQKVDV